MVVAACFLRVVSGHCVFRAVPDTYEANLDANFLAHHVFVVGIDSSHFRGIVSAVCVDGEGLVLTTTTITLLYLIRGWLGHQKGQNSGTFFPGKFDIWLGSHQIFHVLVVLGPAALYWGYSPFLRDASCPAYLE